MSNGDSGADTNPALFEHVEQPVDYNALIETALTVEFGTEPDGANFTVNLRQIELTPEQRGAIKNDIINVIIDRIGHPPTPPEMLGESDEGESDEGDEPPWMIDVHEGLWKKYGRYKSLGTSFAPPGGP